MLGTQQGRGGDQGETSIARRNRERETRAGEENVRRQGEKRIVQDDGEVKSVTNYFRRDK